jgi:hypothetical protein
LVAIIFVGANRLIVVAPSPHNLLQEEVPLVQDHVAVLSNAKEKLVAHCHVVAERLAEGWKPWSSNDIAVLIQVGEAITVLDRLIKQEPTVVSPSTVVSSPEFADA